MNIAIVGAGLAGLGASWHLLKHPGVSVTIFDPLGPGRAASGISTGLLHPFPGKHAHRSWRASEGMQASLELLKIAEEAMGRPVFAGGGIVRMAITEEQKRDFFLRSQEEPDTQWWEETPIALAAKAPSLYIPEGITVFSRLYLEGLWQACAAKGAKLERNKIESVQELSSFDRVLLTTGSGALLFPECAALPLKTTIGQTLLCRWPEKIPYSLLSSGHITPTEDPELCQIGSTYEHTEKPDRDKALALLEKVAAFYPPARHFPVLEIRSGVRIAPKNGYKPLCLKLKDNLFLFTGLGSRGLLYHALLGQEIARMVLNM